MEKGTRGGDLMTQTGAHGSLNRVGRKEGNVIKHGSREWESVT